MTNPPPQTLRLGHLLSPHGIAGGIKLFCVGDPTQLRGLDKVFIEKRGWLHLKKIEFHHRAVVLFFTGVTDRNAATELAGLNVYATEEALPPLPEGEYYYHELRGLPVQYAGKLVGTVDDVQDVGYGDLLVVGGSLLPLQAPYVSLTRNEEGNLCGVVLTENAPEGLFEIEIEEATNSL